MSFKPSMEPAQDAASPLVRFKAVLKGYEGETFTPEGQTARTRVKFNFIDVEVIEANEPYPHPIAVITLPYSERADTQWDVWKKSAVALLPQRDIDLLVGKQQEWHFTTAKLRATGERGTDQESVWAMREKNAWQIVGLEGATNGATAGKSLNEALIDRLDGKTQKEFSTLFFTDSELKSMPGFDDAISQMTDGDLLGNMVIAGLVTKDSDGVYHRA